MLSPDDIVSGKAIQHYAEAFRKLFAVQTVMELKLWEPEARLKRESFDDHTQPTVIRTFDQAYEGDARHDVMQSSMSH